METNVNVTHELNLLQRNVTNRPAKSPTFCRRLTFFSSAMENLRNIAYAYDCVIINNKKMVDSPERPMKAKKFKGSFQYKLKYKTTWFCSENCKNYKNVITNSKLGEFYFYCKICTKDVSCSCGGASNLVTQSLWSEKRHT